MGSLVEVPDSFLPGDLLPLGHVEFPAVQGRTYYIAITSPALAHQGNTVLNWQTKGNTGHITGTVTATNGGTLLQGMQVDAYRVGGAGNSLRTVTTGAGGTYDLTGLGTGSYQVRFTDPAPTTYLTEWFDNKLTQAASTPVAVTNGSTTSGKNAVLDRASSIRGTVRIGGTPRQDVLVQLLMPTPTACPDPNSPSTMTNASGAYSFTGLYPKVGAGNYYVVQFVEPFNSGLTAIFYNQKTSALLADKLQPAEGTSLTVHRWLVGDAAPGTLSGTVTSGGVGLGGVTVSVPGNGSTTTAANGTYNLAGITPGTYTATYSKAGYVTQTTERDDRHRTAPSPRTSRSCRCRAPWPAPSPRARSGSPASPSRCPVPARRPRPPTAPTPWPASLRAPTPRPTPRPATSPSRRA